MLSRWYSLFLGFLLIVLGIAGLIFAGHTLVGRGGLVATSIIWLILRSPRCMSGSACETRLPYAGLPGWSAPFSSSGVLSR